MTIKATFQNGTTMLFGDSYKRWWTQLAEYCGTYRKEQPSVRISREPWISFGGLKWCSPDQFRVELIQEGKGRSISDFTFRPLTQIEQRILNKYIKP